MGRASRFAFAVFTAGLALAAGSASARDPESTVEPQVMFRWTFGGPRPATPQASLRLDYASDLRAAAPPGVQLPAIAEWTFAATGADTLSLNGLPVRSGNMFAEETGRDRDESQRNNTGATVGLILLGAGAATALIVGALGHAAEENNPSVSDNQGSVACNQNPIGSSCAVGGGG